MSIPLPLAQFMCSEHAYRAFPSEILLLGRQSICMDEATLRALAQRWDLVCGDIELDRKTVSALYQPERRWITDTSFFSLFGITTIHAIDHSDFEGADMIHDICQPMDCTLDGKFDLIFNGSVLDNVFNPSAALMNVGRLLSPGGRVIHIETATTNQYSYQAISPSWFVDYAAYNDWDDCRVYFGTTRDLAGLVDGPWGMMTFDAGAAQKPNAYSPNLGAETGVMVIVAQKGESSTWDKVPVQSHYRSDKDWDELANVFSRFATSDRPLYLGAHGTGEPIESYGGVWRSCGWW